MVIIGDRSIIVDSAIIYYNDPMFEKYYTEVSVKKSRDQIDYSDKLFFMGSCFARNLYKRVDSYRLDCMEAPFGNIYNPISMIKLLNILLKEEMIEEHQLIESDGLYQHFNIHSLAGKSTKESYLDQINPQIIQASKFLKQTDWLILTLGTAFIYERDGEVVNNCHKLPRKDFNRRVIDLDKTIKHFKDTLNTLRKLNPEIKIVLTLSPVRHLRDEPTENSLSKALLRVLIDRLLDDKKIYYFPSFEILIDELRDYRWYDSSLTHPSEGAVTHIMDKFFTSYGSDEFNIFRIESDKVQNMLNHKILKPESSEAKKFILKREERLKEFMRKYPKIRSYYDL